MAPNRPVAREPLRGATFRAGIAMMVEDCRRFPVPAAVAIGASIANGLCTVLFADVIGSATDDLVLGSFERGELSTGVAVATALALIGVALLRVLSIVTRTFTGGTVQFRGLARTRTRLADHYLDSGSRWHRGHPTGRLLAHAVSDADSAHAPMQHFPFAVGMTGMLLAVLVQVFRTDTRLGVIAAVLIPALIATNVVYQRVLSPRARQVQSRRAEVAALAHEAIAGAQVIRTLGATDDETRRFTGAAHELARANRSAGRVGAIFDPLIELTPSFAVLVVLLVGVVRIEAGAVTIGALVSVVYLLLTMAMPLGVIGRFLAVLPAGVVGRRRVEAVLAESESEPSGSASVPHSVAPARLRADAVSYRFADADRPAVDSVDLDLRPGRIVALVGRNGSGKSTLVALLTRLFPPTSGTVTLDDVDLATTPPGHTARHVALVTQTPFVFAGSVRDNLTLWDDGIDEAAVRRALALAEAGFVDELPDGLDTVIGDGHARLSGGQRQRIALARALVRRPRVLVLDDATSALDPAVERAVVDNLRAEFSQGRSETTILVVAHRPAMISLADEVVFVDQGRVVATGTHAGLAASVPAYRDLVTAYDDNARTAELEGATR
ncbi:ABC transporter ATP-binding protein [Rhodococcus rhodochrous]|nr:ABC transporter ATP-binding protein [Rhodococcus rhodochrous]